MNVLFVGDLIGKAGRRAVRAQLKTVQEQYCVDFTIANIENSAGGFGITPPLVTELFGYGIDVMTSGNHIWDKREVLGLLDTEPRLLRPGNYPHGVPGKGLFVGETRKGDSIAVLNLQGRVFMPIIDCPFRCAEKYLEDLPKECPVIVDFHAEATSEKMALGSFLDGRVSAVLGTHTHVPTADSRILPRGTAYITDVGMTGSYVSVIGMKAESAISRFLTGLPGRFEPATEDPVLCSVLIEIDETTGKSRSIRQIQVE
jgi:metallophosphoesterase (TIGR00282 family)